MTLKEELQILRGESIEVFVGDPLDIPCIETSDKDKLCKRPVVSVNMITYNHEQYIRQAIESVMMQKTSFEFELVIGEDCSQDKTREICFEYQKKYPDKIRVLWWHENVSKLGGNGRRNRAHCRGEFIAFCQGDDYWIDPMKLQKQIDVMRRFPSVVLLFAGAQVLNQSSGAIAHPVVESSKHGLVKGNEFFYELASERQVSRHGVDPNRLRTPTAVVSVPAMKKALSKFSDLFSWSLYLGDTSLWLSLATIGDVYYLPEVVSVYRRHGGGISSANYYEVMRDATVVKMYFCAIVYGYHLVELAKYFKGELFLQWVKALSQLPINERRHKMRELRRYALLRVVFDGIISMPHKCALYLNCYYPQVQKWLRRVYWRLACLQCPLPVPKKG